MTPTLRTLILAALCTACAPDPFALPVKRIEVRASHHRWMQLIGNVQVWHDEKVTHRYAVSRDGRYCRLTDAEHPRVAQALFCAWVEPESIEWWD